MIIILVFFIRCLGVKFFFYIIYYNIMSVNENKKTFNTSLRILGVEMPVKKHVHIALQKIYGIGQTLAVKICKTLDISMTVRMKDIDDNTVARISKYIEEDLANEGNLVEGSLKSKKREDLRVLQHINCYRWSRHRKGLPINSRTKTNAQTSRILHTRRKI